MAIGDRNIKKKSNYSSNVLDKIAKHSVNNNFLKNIYMSGPSQNLLNSDNKNNIQHILKENMMKSRIIFIFFLEKIEEIINNNNDTFKAQKYIEEKWVYIAFNSLNIKSSFFQNSNSIFNDAWYALEYIKHKGV